MRDWTGAGWTVHTPRGAASSASPALSAAWPADGYIFDGDELDDTDLGVNVHETAQYSVHCVAVAFDRSARVAVIADPNGAIVRGASMEFIAVPPRARAGGATTALSQSDIDARAEEMEA